MARRYACSISRSRRFFSSLFGIRVRSVLVEVAGTGVMAAFAFLCFASSSSSSSPESDVSISLARFRPRVARPRTGIASLGSPLALRLALVPRESPSVIFCDSGSDGSRDVVNSRAFASASCCIVLGTLTRGSEMGSDTTSSMSASISATSSSSLGAGATVFASNMIESVAPSNAAPSLD